MGLETERLPEQPKDTINLDGDIFHGTVFVYRGDVDHLRVVEVDFHTRKGEPLKPFYYEKPVVGENLFESPTLYKKDEKTREGYYVIALIRKARRSPNHLYQEEDAFAAAVQMDPLGEKRWETRYFPQSGVEKELWSEVLSKIEQYTISLKS